MTLSADDVLQIHHVLADYGHVVDDHLWERGGDVFAEDFVFDLSAVGAPDLHGVADLEANFKGRNMYAHLTTNITIVGQDDDDHVRVLCMWIGFPNEGPPITGDYQDVLVRTPAGWRLQRRKAITRARKFFD